MATVFDHLVTVLAIQGATQYRQGLAQAAEAAQGLATATDKAASGTRGLGGNMRLFGAAGIGAGLALFHEMLRATSDTEQQVFRTTAVLRNMGNSFPIEKATALADALRANSSANEGELIGLIGLIKQFGVADNQVEKAAKSILDFSRLEGIDLHQAGEAVLKGMLGRGVGLKQYGIQVMKTGTEVQKLADIERQIAARGAGAAAAQVDTLAGAVGRLQASWTNMLDQVGSRFETVLIPLLQRTADLLDLLAKHPTIAGAGVGAAIGGAIGGGIGTLAGNPLGGLAIGALAGTALGGIIGSLPAHENPANKIGIGKPATEDTLRQIADNTSGLEKAISHVFGGSGEIFRRAFTVRDMRMSHGI